MKKNSSQLFGKFFWSSPQECCFSFHQGKFIKGDLSDSEIKLFMVQDRDFFSHILIILIWKWKKKIFDIFQCFCWAILSIIELFKMNIKNARQISKMFSERIFHLLSVTAKFSSFFPIWQHSYSSNKKYFSFFLLLHN